MGAHMKKLALATVCMSSLLLQGCWTTMTKDNPLFADCSSYHDRKLAESQQSHYVTAVTANGGRCYGAGGESIAMAKKAAILTCQSNSHPDCVVYAEDRKIVLPSTVKEREMDWDSTFTILTLGMAGAVAYEAGKSEVSSAPYVPPQAYSPPQHPRQSNSYTPVISNNVPASSVPPAGMSSTGALSSSGSQFVPHANQCLTFVPGKTDGNASWFTLRNTCSFAINAHWCDSRGEQCDTRSAADIPPGGSTSSWYLNTRYTGISRGACPAKHNGKSVVEVDWRCKVMSW